MSETRKLSGAKDSKDFGEMFMEIRSKIIEKLSKDGGAAKARSEYIDSEAKLLERLSGNELELLNNMIEANEEYRDLLFDSVFLTGFKLGMSIYK